MGTLKKQPIEGGQVLLSSFVRGRHVPALSGAWAAYSLAGLLTKRRKPLKGEQVQEYKQPSQKPKDRNGDEG